MITRLFNTNKAVKLAFLFAFSVCGNFCIAQQTDFSKLAGEWEFERAEFTGAQTLTVTDMSELQPLVSCYGRGIIKDMYFFPGGTLVSLTSFTEAIKDAEYVTFVSGNKTIMEISLSGDKGKGAAPDRPVARLPYVFASEGDDTIKITLETVCSNDAGKSQNSTVTTVLKRKK